MVAKMSAERSTQELRKRVRMAVRTRFNAAWRASAIGLGDGRVLLE
jgi:hypothetical protein